jgi:hypothetical protein
MSRNASARLLAKRSLVAAAFLVGLALLLRLNYILFTFVIAYVVLVPVSQRWTFARNWGPFLIGVYVFNATRGWIYTDIIARGRPVFGAYAIAADRALLGGHVAPEVLQWVRATPLDWMAFALHATHFCFFLLFTIVTWRHDHAAGRWVQRALMVVFACGLAGYYFVPTIPPWMAAEQGALAPIQHVAMRLYSLVLTQGQVRLVDTNPVAAMPSIHVAFPVACAMIGWHTYGRRAGLLLWIYAGAQSLGVMYLGEHYAVDVLAGLAIGVGSALATRRRQPLSVDAGHPRETAT